MTILASMSTAQRSEFAAALLGSTAYTAAITFADRLYMKRKQVTGAITFTKDVTGAIVGGSMDIELVANGSNAPDFSAFKEWDGSTGYLNTAGIVNYVHFEFTGLDYMYSVNQANNPVAAPRLTSAAAATGGTSVTLTYSAALNTGSAPATSAFTLSNTGGTQNVTSVTVNGDSTITLATSRTVQGTDTITVTYTPPTTNGVLGSAGEYAGGVSAFSVTVSVPDTTAPTLSSPTDTKTGSTTATLGVTTDEGNGTLYWFVSTSSTPPSAANLKDGTGAAKFGNQAVSATGAQSVSVTALTAATQYYSYFLHRDAAGNDSSIASADGFLTDSAVTYLRFPNLAGGTHAVETANGSGWDYGRDTDSGAFNDNGFATALKLAAAQTTGGFHCTYAGKVGTDGCMVAYQTTSTAAANFGSYAAAVYVSGAGAYQLIGLTAGSSVTPAANDIIRVRKQMNGSNMDVVFEVSQNGGGSWTTLGTKVNTANIDIYGALQATDRRQVVQPIADGTWS